MNWLGKDIKDLTNQELTEASEKLIQMQTFRDDKLLKKKTRHNGINFENTNPAFDELKKAIGKEIVDRGL